MNYHFYNIVAMDYVAFRDTCLEMTDMIDERLQGMNSDYSDRTVEISTNVDGHSMSMKNFKRFEEVITPFYNSPITSLKYEFRHYVSFPKKPSITYTFTLEVKDGELRAWIHCYEDMTDTNLPLDLSIMIKRLAKRYKGRLFDARRYPKWALAIMSLDYVLPIGLDDLGRYHHPNMHIEAVIALAAFSTVMSGINLGISFFTRNPTSIFLNVDCLKRLSVVIK